MLRVGVAGVGFMGWIHWLAWQQVEGIEVTAIFSRNPAKQAGDWTSIQGNFGPPGQQVDLANIDTHDDYGSMIADESLDLIDICLPPGMHCDHAAAAFAAGHHVFCEKPMALTTQQCDRMLAAAKDAKKHLMVGHVLPFFPEYAFVRDLADRQTYGSLLGGEFKRTVSDPTWIDGFFEPDIAGGPLIDLTVHDAHFIRALFGQPVAVTSVGRMRGKTVEYCTSIFDFAKRGFVVSSHGGVINQQGRPFTHGFEVHFEQATVQFEFGGFADNNNESMPLKILTADGQVLRPDLGDGDPVAAFVSELNEVTSVLNGKQDSSPILDGRLARDAIVICDAQSRSVQSGEKVALDAEPG